MKLMCRVVKKDGPFNEGFVKKEINRINNTDTHNNNNPFIKTKTALGCLLKRKYVNIIASCKT